MSAADDIPFEEMYTAEELADAAAILYSSNGTNGPIPLDDEIVFETLRAFLKRELPPNVSLVGTPRNGTNLLPQFGWVMPWGPAGAGKTSVLVDLVFHACSGVDWLDFPIDRPLKIVVVINEGVPAGLQDKLRQKTEHWDGDDPLTNLAVYASPWGEFSFKNERAAAHARDYALDFEADYVAFDPLHTLGTIGAGTPEETETFKHQLRGFGLWQDLGVITAHHSNKGGMVSGDWARHPDTVIHLEKDGKSAATKFTIQKARPADPTELGVPFLLDWETDTLGYTRRSIAITTKSDAEITAEILEVVAAQPGITITDLRKAITGDDATIGNLAKAQLERGGKLENVATKRKTFKFQVRASTDLTDVDHEGEQIGMDTEDPPCKEGSQTSSLPGDAPVSGSLSVCDPLTPGGGQQTQTTTGQDNDDIELP